MIRNVVINVKRERIIWTILKRKLSTGTIGLDLHVLILQERD
jgi:hypothetical protein